LFIEKKSLSLCIIHYYEKQRHSIEDNFSAPTFVGGGCGVTSGSSQGMAICISRFSTKILHTMYSTNYVACACSRARVYLLYTYNSTVFYKHRYGLPLNFGRAAWRFFCAFLPMAASPKRLRSADGRG
jgi:hypothetical protein